MIQTDLKWEFVREGCMRGNHLAVNGASFEPALNRWVT